MLRLGEQWECTWALGEPSEAVAAVVAAAGLQAVSPVVRLPWGRGWLATQLLAESHVIAVPSEAGLWISLFSCRPLERRALEAAGEGAWSHFVRGPMGAARRVTARALLAPCPAHPAALVGALGLSGAPQVAHAFSPVGHSVVASDGRGWAAIHTWPEHGLVAVDVGGQADAALSAMVARGRWRALAESADD